MEPNAEPSGAATQARGAAEEEVRDAFRQGAADAAAAADTVLPMLGKWLSRGVYGGCYLASYGVVFGALTASRLLPPESAVLKGLEAGAEAARKDVEGYRDARVIVPEGTGGSSQS